MKNRKFNFNSLKHDVYYFVDEIKNDLAFILIRPFRSIKQYALQMMWRYGHFQGSDNTENSHFLDEFLSKSSKTVIDVVMEVSVTDFINAFYNSDNDGLFFLFKHMSRRAGDMLLSDILNARNTTNVSKEDIRKSQAVILKTLKRIELCQ